MRIAIAVLAVYLWYLVLPSGQFTGPYADLSDCNRDAQTVGGACVWR